jgi:hypothetical protein
LNVADPAGWQRQKDHRTTDRSFSGDNRNLRARVSIFVFSDKEHHFCAAPNDNDVWISIK